MRDGRASEQALKEFLDLWERLLTESEGDQSVVVVEGERDRRSLRQLGFGAPIALVHRGDSLSVTAHRLSAGGRRVVILTDWDREGGQLARRLKEFLEAERVPLDLEYRRRLAKVLRGELAHVEGLYGWARRLAERRGTSLEQLLGPTATA